MISDEDKLLGDLVYSEAKVEDGIAKAKKDCADSRNKESSVPRYNPFYLLQENAELDTALELDQQYQQIIKDIF